MSKSSVSSALAKDRWKHKNLQISTG